MSRLLLILLGAALAVPAIAPAAVEPQLDTVRLDVYFVDGEANTVNLMAYPYGKVSRLTGRVEGVKGRFAFKDRSRTAGPGAAFKTYSACQDENSLSRSQREQFAAIAGTTGVKVKLAWRYKGTRYKRTITVAAAGAEGNGPSCADLEGRAA